MGAAPGRFGFSDDGSSPAGCVEVPIVGYEQEKRCWREGVSECGVLGVCWLTEGIPLAEP